MSSGIPGESIGIYGVLADPGINASEAALGYFPLKGRQIPGPLWDFNTAAEPGSRWYYSDPAFAHLGLAFNHITGQELANSCGRVFLARSVLKPPVGKFWALMMVELDLTLCLWAACT